MKKIEYDQALSSKDRMWVSFRKSRGKILIFVVQYYALVEGEWRTIMRIDNYHGRAHKHIFHLSGREYRVELDEDPNIAFSGGVEYIKSTFKAIKENFILTR